MRFAVGLAAAVACAADTVGTTWTDALTLSVGGRPFPDLAGNLSYTRLPPAAEADVPEWVWYWSRTSSGMFVQFQTDAQMISTNYTLTSANWSQFSNFPPTGFSGIDLYRWDDATSVWRWLATSFNGLSAENEHGSGVVTDAPLFVNNSGWPVGPAPAQPVGTTTFRYRIHLPSYNGVQQMSIGVPTGATITPDDSWRTAASVTLPITYYGTSITQGGVTARPGQIYTNRIGRALGLPVVNMGFCGSCRMEPVVGSYLAQVPSSLFVIDCGWNMDPALIANNTVPLVLQLRKAQPAVPILLVEPSDYRPAWILGDVFNNTGRRIELAAAYAQLLAQNVSGIYYQRGEALFAADGETDDPTFEGTHPHDHGHRLIADVLTPVIGGILGLPGFARQQPMSLAQLQAVTTRSAARMRAAPAAISADAMPPASPPLSYSQQGASSNGAAAGQTWVPVTALTMWGHAFNNTPTPFNRLPAAAEGVVRAAVWSLSLNSAGLLVSFLSNSSSFAVNYTAQESFQPMVHFAVSGISGMELYSWDDNTSVWRHVQPLQLSYAQRTYDSTFVSGILPAANGGLRRYLLHLPTYNNPVALQVGVDAGAAIQPDPASSISPSGASVAGPIVWYGTSILQGGVSFKSSRIFTNTISRNLGVEIFNFGFSGNGEMEISVAQFLTTIANAAAFIIDCDHNMDAATISQNAVPLVQYLRQTHPMMPIIMAEGTPLGIDWAVPASWSMSQQANAALRGAFTQLVAAGDKHLYYVTMEQLFNQTIALDSPTAAGLHPTDEGGQEVAGFWTGFLPSIIGL